MRKLTVGLLVAVVVFAAASPVHAIECEGFSLDDGCHFTITGGDTSNPIDGYPVTNADGVPLWDFVRDRAAHAIGYPISQRWTEGPFTLQAFQKVILQWDPGQQRMNYLNTLDALANRYPWVELPFVPAHQVLAEDQGATFGTIIRNHLALLDQNEAIKQRFLSEPDWLNLYGLPIRYEEREVEGNPVGVQLLRTQRTVFVVWNVPAPGVTVGRVNLQNVPDKLKKLSNVVIPDTAKLLAPAPEALLHSEIQALPWVADGLLPHEEPIVLLLRRLSSASQELLWTLLVERPAPWVQHPPTAETQATLNFLVAFAEIPWTRKHLGPAQPLLLSVLLNAPFDHWPSSFRKLLLKPWIQDGVTWDEMVFSETVLRSTIALPHAYPAHDRTPADVNGIVTTMLDMPFLTTFDGYENQIVDRILRGYGRINPQTGDFEWLTGLEVSLQLLHGFVSTGGITDRQAIFEALDGPAHFRGNPVEYAYALDREANNYSVSQKDIFVPLSGRIRLVLVNNQAISLDTVDTLESILNEIVAYTRIPFPSDDLIVRVWPSHLYFPDDRPGRKIPNRIEIRPHVLPHNSSISHDGRRILANLIARYYNNRVRAETPYWAAEGLAAIFEVGLGYRHPDWVPEGREFAIYTPRRPIDCTIYSVVELWRAGSAECHAHFGASFFLDLYRSLDQMSFRNGLAGIITALNGVYPLWSECSTESRFRDIPCVYSPLPPLDKIFTDAFTSGATTPEAAATARALIQRWWYGG